MQSIIGYSDDDRSDDELKRPSSLKTLSKSKSKDTLLKPIPITTAPSSIKASTSSTSGSLVNVSLTLNTFRWPAYGRGTPSVRPSPGSSVFRDRNQGIVRTLIPLTNCDLAKPAARFGKSKAGLSASIIRRTTSAQPSKPTEQPDASTSNSLHDHERETSPQQTPVEPSLQDLSLGPNVTSTSDGGELAQIRALLQPPPIPGVEDFGIPPPSENKVDPELAAKVAKFLALKKQGTHFNDILMRNKSFNNPHIYAKLVDFVDVDETGTNFPKNMWDPHDIQPECLSARYYGYSY
ncbi:hypothetical protein FRC10_008244 [Ceratobasidium sp. 414]|nr:hypothetical protein FRC10_008244 [Ceratobasidium sp. 414]